MKILDIPKPVIDLITKLNCHEFSMGDVISNETASDLLIEVEDFLLWLNDITNEEGVITSDVDMKNIDEIISQFVSILIELEDEGIDRLKVTMEYRELYNQLIEMIFSETTFDELDDDEVEYLNFIPTSKGWILPVCFRVIYDDNLEVYNRYTDEPIKFGDIGYNDHDGILFDYYYKNKED